MPLNKHLEEIPKWPTLVRCATQIGVVRTWFRIDTVWWSGIFHDLISVWSCGFEIEGILLANLHKSVTKGYISVIIWKLNLVLGVITVPKLWICLMQN
jgi:hypothetical protein